MKGGLLTCASGDNKLLQTHVHIQIFLEDWKLERERRNKEEAFLRDLLQYLLLTFYFAL